METLEAVLNIECLSGKSPQKSKVRFFVYLLYASVLLGCVKSPSPSAEEVLKVSAPYFGITPGTTTLIYSPNINYTIVGTCDSANGYIHEWSLNQTTWTAFTCTNNQFSIPLVLTTQRTVSVRSRGKFIYSDIGQAIVRLLLPPTSDVVTQVASSRADDTDGMGAGTQNFLSINWASQNITNGVVNLSSGVPRLVYE